MPARGNASSSMPIMVVNVLDPLRIAPTSLARSGPRNAISTRSSARKNPHRTSAEVPASAFVLSA